MTFLEKCLSNQMKQGRSWALLLGEQHVCTKTDVSSHLINQGGCIMWERTSNLFSSLTALQWQPALEMMGTLFNSPMLLCAGRGNTPRVKCCCLMVPSQLIGVEEQALIAALGNMAAPSFYWSLHGTRSADINPEEIFKRLPQRYSRRKNIRAGS